MFDSRFDSGNMRNVEEVDTNVVRCSYVSSMCFSTLMRIPTSNKADLEHGFTSVCMVSHLEKCLALQFEI